MKKLTTLVAGVLFLTLAAGEQQAGAGNGAPPGDAFKCYSVNGIDVDPPVPALPLEDQFEVDTARVVETEYICNPARVNGSEVTNSARHYACFLINGKSAAPNPPVNVFVTNILGVNQELKVKRPERLLCVPSLKDCIAENEVGETITVPCPNEVGLSN